MLGCIRVGGQDLDGCGVSLSLMVCGPPGYEDKGSRGSGQDLARAASTMEITFQESASVRLVNFIPE